jgi:uncharacterized membrane protein YraQ (UPF0718 family)
VIGKGGTRKSPSAYVKRVDNLVVAGQWIASPGGIPDACTPGKWAVYRLDHLLHKTRDRFRQIAEKIFLSVAILVASKIILP